VVFEAMSTHDLVEDLDHVSEEMSAAGSVTILDYSGEFAVPASLL